jgi:glycerol-3-phosphate dehydrogenase
LTGRYGQDAVELLQSAVSSELAPVDRDLGRIALQAELRWAARSEGVVHLEDLLLRRVRLGLLLPKGGLDHMASIRAIIQPELGWDDQRWVAEEQAYASRWHEFYGSPHDRYRQERTTPQNATSAELTTSSSEPAAHPV